MLTSVRRDALTALEIVGIKVISFGLRVIRSSQTPRRAKERKAKMKPLARYPILTTTILVAHISFLVGVAPLRGWFPQGVGCECQSEYCILRLLYRCGAVASIFW